jgi:pyruvate/2-oxoglutarate dehydrogenase complex dihydrolipoamide dehydrogenase (E3) component
MSELLTPDLCIIGAGSAGLAIAAGAQQMGAECVLIEKGEMGGDCLNYGCVPSKSLLAAGKAAVAGKLAAKYGVDYAAPSVDMQRVHDHVQGVIAAIAPHDSVERFEGLGVTVIKAEARFTGPREVVAGGATIRARRFVVATGSRPATPPVEGLAELDYLTNESVFGLTETPDHLIILGGGPIGCELGQAFRRLGAEVTVVEMFRALGKDDPELAEVVRAALRDEGVQLLENTKVLKAERAEAGVRLTLSDADGERRISGSHLLVAAGRAPQVDGLDLEKAGVTFDRGGIKTDAKLKTTNKKIFAAGDVAGRQQFTHIAGYHAGVVIKNALFRLPAKLKDDAVPWVTYTDPELAHVGLTEAMAKEKGLAFETASWSFEDNDRAQAERRTEGRLKAIVTPKGKVLGCSIVGVNAGELILPWGLMIQKGLRLGDLAQVIAPYPTLSEVSKRAAGAFFTPKLYGEKTRKLVNFLARFG